MGAVLSRPVADDGEALAKRGNRYLPSTTQLAISATFWLAFRFLGNTVYPALLLKHTTAFATFSPTAQRHTSLYINSTIHALALSVVGWYKLCGRLLSDEKEHGEHADDDSGGGVVESKRDVFDESDESDGEGKTSAAAESTSAPVSLWARIRHHVTCRNLLAFSLGYFVNDFVESRQDWISNKSNFFHHAFGIVLETLGMTIIPRRLDWLISAFFVLESSTVCLDIMWLLRAFGQEGSPLYKGSVTAFIALFTSLRVVMLPCFVQHLRKKHKKTWNDLGVFGKAGVYGVTGLQMYWFVKIIKRFILT